MAEQVKAAAEAANAAAPAAQQAQPAADAAAAENPAFTPAEKQAYLLKVIAKQAGVDEAGATAIAAKLDAAKLTALHDAGREGRVADCRALLGL